MRAGKLDRTIAIERKSETVSDSGSAVTAWTNVASARAEIVRQSSDEYSTGFGEAETGTVIFRIRYLGGVTTADRITFDGTAYNIKEIAEIGRRRGLELRAVAVS